MVLIIINDNVVKPESTTNKQYIYTGELYKLLMTGGLSHSVTTFEQRLDMCVSIAQNQIKRFVNNKGQP